MKPIPTETATDVGSVGKWLGAAATGALLMYLLDPERGSARRSRALSALRTAGARTGATVDHALHSAGDRLVGLKDSAASALSRGAGRLQAQAAPMIERARHGAQEAAHRFEDSAERIRERARTGAAGTARDDESGPDRSLTRNSYEPDRQYDAGNRERGGLSGWLRGARGGNPRSEDADYLSRDARNQDYRSQDYRSQDYHGRDYREAAHPALVGGGALGLLSLMRRSPGGLLVGLAGLALLWQSTRDKTYRVSDNMSATPPRMKKHDEGAQAQAPMIPPAEESGSRYLH